MVNHSSINEINIDSNNRALFDIYPLNNSFNSLNGKKPYDLAIRNFNLDKDRSFNYDPKIKRYVYVADGSMLAYKFGNSNVGTIAMRVCLELRRSTQYLFYSYNSSGQIIALYTDVNGLLRYKVGSNYYSTGITLDVNTWYNIAFSYTNTYDSYIGGSMNIRVVANNQSYTNTLTTTYDFLSLITIIGRAKDESTTSHTSNIKETTSSQLYGLIEGLCYRGAYCELSTITNLFNNYKINLAINHYNELGLLTKKEVVINDTTLISNNVREYQQTDNGIKYNYKEEIIKVKGNVITTITYKLDNNGNVLAISDPLFGNKTYTYNYRGYLTSENENIYSYDENGNIQSPGKSCVYGNYAIKDRLDLINGTFIVYNNVIDLYPASYQNKYFEFEGNKLKSLAIDSNVYSYKYNYNGLRTHKYLNNTLTNRYYYEGNKLITDYRSSTDRLDFLYNSNGLLYGFINNKTTRYYYVRDILQNILGIVDSNGNLVVKYNYTAFGEVTVVSDTSGISLATRNPFKWKGYYYDVETNLFWFNSRYYNPELCRFIQPADVSSLNLSNINGLNLYSYANNNPIGIAYSGFGVGTCCSLMNLDY